MQNETLVTLLTSLFDGTARPPPRRMDIEERYSDAHPALREVRAQEGAAERHEWRVAATIFAAAGGTTCAPETRVALLAYLSGEPVNGPTVPLNSYSSLPEEIALVGTIIRLDIGGTGGRGGYAGGSTARMPWARNLGAGRWLAHDGEVWRAAAETAAQLLGVWKVTPALVCLLKDWGMVDHAAEWLVAACLRGVADPGTEHTSEAWCAALDHVVGELWRDAAVNAWDGVTECGQPADHLGEEGMPTHANVWAQLAEHPAVKLAQRYGVDPSTAYERSKASASPAVEQTSEAA